MCLCLSQLTLSIVCVRVFCAERIKPHHEVDCFLLQLVLSLVLAKGRLIGAYRDLGGVKGAFGSFKGRGEVDVLN